MIGPNKFSTITFVAIFRVFQMIAQSTELVEYSRATEIATKYASAVDNIRRLIGELKVQTDTLQEAFSRETGYTSDFEIEVSHHRNSYKLDDKGVESLVTEFKRAAWSILIDKLSIRKLMSSKARSELDEALNSSWSRHRQEKIQELPEINGDSIVNVLSGFVQSAPEYFAESVTEVYKWLIPMNWQGGHVTNQRDRVGKKVIRSWVVEQGYGGKRFHVRYQVRGELNALDTIFHTLDGKGVIPGHEGPLVSAIAVSEDGTGETEYFKFRAFKNGNLHIEFKRDDLLQEFNRIAADGHRVGAKRQ